MKKSIILSILAITILTAGIVYATQPEAIVPVGETHEVTPNEPSEPASEDTPSEPTQPDDPEAPLPEAEEPATPTPQPPRTLGRGYDPTAPVVQSAPEAVIDPLTIMSVSITDATPTARNPTPGRTCQYTLYNGVTEVVMQPQTKPCQLEGDIFYAYA